MPKLLPQQRQADELPILVTVADNGAALGRHRQHRHQLRFGAGLQADGDVFGGDDILYHRFLLIDLDRKQRRITVGVVQLGDVLFEGTGQLAHAVLENIRKAHQQRQIQPAVAQLRDQLVQIDRRVDPRSRTHLHVAEITGIEVTRPPMANAIDTSTVCDRPGGSILFARTPR